MSSKTLRVSAMIHVPDHAAFDVKRKANNGEPYYAVSIGTPDEGEPVTLFMSPDTLFRLSALMIRESHKD